MIAMRCALLCLLLGGCSSGFFETKIAVATVYVLAPAKLDSSVSSAAPLDVDLAIALPVAAPGLDTERIAALYDARRLDYYKDAQWGALAATVTQSLLVTTLQNQKLFRSVTPEQARVSATHVLDVQLQDFQAEYAAGKSNPSARVSMTASLIRLKDRKLLASFPIGAAVDADANRMNAVIAAFEAAAQQVALRVGERTAATLRVD